jgi:hypothetical protein
LSFSLDDSSIARFIGTSLETLRYEFPTAYLLLGTQLASCSLLLVIDGEPVALTFDPGGAHLRPQLYNPTIQLHTSRQTILDVIDANLTLHEAVLADAILLQGDIADLAAFHEGLLTYVRGVVRCPSFPALLDRFRYVSSPLLHRNDQANTR